MSTIQPPQTRPPTTSPPVPGPSAQLSGTVGQADRLRFVPTLILQRELERRRALQEMRRRRISRQAHRDHEAARDRALMLGALVTR